MTSPKFLFYLTCLFLGKIAQTSDDSVVRQESGFISANVGENITLRCFYKGGVVKRFYWFKQTLGQEPRIISMFYRYSHNGTFYDEFLNNPRFTLDTGEGCIHLKIADLRISDSATYYCASYSRLTYMSEYVGATTLSVKGSGSNVKAWVHQSASETIQPGDSVTLNCTVHTGTCDGEHSVYWFKNQDEESHPGLIYTHGGRNDQCERKPDTQTHTCVYNLPTKSLNLSHAGTYYCAVASCGHILFGEGPKLDFGDEEDPPVLVYLLSGALAFTTILALLLASFLYNMSKRNSCQCTDSHTRVSTASDAESRRAEENIHYAALRVKNRSTRQREDTGDTCLYSSVKL